MKKERIIMCCFLFAALHIFTFTWVSPHQEDHNAPHFPEAVLTSKQGLQIKTSIEGRYMNRMLGRLGSRPPNCEQRCRGCTPCVATQLPATTDKLRPEHFANYEPEGWKCKCGSFFFNP